MKESSEKETTVEAWYYMRTLASVEILSQTALNQDLMLKVVVTSFERKPSRVCFGCIAASIRARGGDGSLPLTGLADPAFHGRVERGVPYVYCGLGFKFFGPRLEPWPGRGPSGRPTIGSLYW